MTAKQLGDEYSLLLTNPIWLTYLADMISRKRYEKEMADLIDSLRANPDNTTKSEYELLIDWQTALRNSKVEKNGIISNKFKATSILGKLSVANAFHLYTGKGSLKTNCPILEKNIVKWMKGEKIKKARTLSKEEMKKYYTLPDNERSVLIKAFVPVALAVSARGCESVLMDFTQVRRVVLENEPGYKVLYVRSKCSDAVYDEEKYFYIRSKIEVAAIDKYIACFAPQDQHGRLWRKINISRGGWVGSNQVVGKNKLSEFGQLIALDLGYSREEAKKITGHWLRRTSVTWGAEAGLTAEQLMVMTGHKSPKVCMGYVADTQAMKLKFADAVAMESPSPDMKARVAEEPCDESPATKKMRSSGNVFHIHLTGNTISAPFHLFAQPNQTE